MEDSAWRALIEGQGWTPGATGAGTPPAGDPAQIMAMIMQAIQGGAAAFSSIHGAITNANAQTGMVTLANGMTVPISALGTLNLGGTATTPPTTIQTDKGFELNPMMLMMIGGMGLVLVLALRK
jgi:hypothetical protein